MQTMVCAYLLNFIWIGLLYCCCGAKKPEYHRSYHIFEHTVICCLVVTGIYVGALIVENTMPTIFNNLYKFL